LAFIDALLVSAVHESTSEQRGNNKLEEGAMIALHHLSQTSPCITMPRICPLAQRYTAWQSIDTKKQCYPNNKASALHGNAMVSPLPSPRLARRRQL
jgi:hypothetical protein